LSIEYWLLVIEPAARRQVLRLPRKWPRKPLHIDKSVIFMRREIPKGIEDSCKSRFRRGGVIPTLFSGTPAGCDRQRAPCPVVPPERDHRLSRQGGTNPAGWRKSEFVSALRGGRSLWGEDGALRAGRVELVSVSGCARFSGARRSAAGEAPGRAGMQ
jgi:hypothetical protein